MRARVPRRDPVLFSILLAAGLSLPAVAIGQGAKGSGPGLDRFLRLPASVDYSSEVKGGANRSEWRQRFAQTRDALAKAEQTLEQSQNKLAAVAGAKSEWQLAPPGLPAQTSQDGSASFTLREEVRRNRGEVDRARARLRELEVQANLAGVPDDWRGSSTVAPSDDGSKNGSATGAASRR